MLTFARLVVCGNNLVGFTSFFQVCSLINNNALLLYSKQLKAALIDTVASGTITGDLKGKTTDPDTETLVDMQGFLDAVEANIPH